MTPYFEFRFVPFGQPLTESLNKALTGLLPDFRRVSAQQLRWSDGMGSTVDLHVERSLLVNVIVSIDLRMRPLQLIAELALIANKHGWEGITDDGRFFRPSLRRFLQELQRLTERGAARSPPGADARGVALRDV